MEITVEDANLMHYEEKVRKIRGLNRKSAQKRFTDRNKRLRAVKTALTDRQDVYR